MYAKSPFRKLTPKQRISEKIPRSHHLAIADGIADGNEGDNSSESEEGGAIAYELDVDKLKSEVAGAKKNS